MITNRFWRWMCWLTLVVFGASARGADVSKTIGSGKDYASVSAWEAASYGATASDNAIGNLYGSVTDAVAFTDTTPLSIVLQAAVGEEHDGTPNSGATIQYGSGTLLYWGTTSMPPTTFRGIELQATAAYAGYILLVYNGATGLTLDKCIIHGIGDSGTGSAFAVISTGTGTELTMTNCLICDYSASTSGDTAAFYVDATGTHKIMNNTMVNIDASNGNCYGFGNNVDDADHEYRNNLVYDITASGTAVDYADKTLSNTVTSNNISEDGESPDVSFRNKTITFVDTGSSDYHLASSESDAINQGSTDADVPSDDIDGDTRDFWPDIGCDEYVSATAMPLFYRLYRGHR